MDPACIPTRQSSRYWQRLSDLPTHRVDSRPQHHHPNTSGEPAPPYHSIDYLRHIFDAGSPENNRFKGWTDQEFAAGRFPRNQQGTVDTKALLKSYRRHLQATQRGKHRPPLSPSLKRKASDADFDDSERPRPIPSTPGRTASNAIDLCSPPQYHAMNNSNNDAPPPPPRTTSVHSHRPSQSRSSPIILPPWQPDSGVTTCPHCHTDFGYLRRKHHCRKCGKVVCDPCSRHRITIPRRFIVQAPDSTTASPFSFLTASPGQQYGNVGRTTVNGHSELEDSDTVRVCNPCVPDPNYSPPPQIPLTSTPFPFTPSSPAPHRRMTNQSERHSRGSNSLYDADVLGVRRPMDRPPPIPARRSGTGATTTFRDPAQLPRSLYQDSDTTVSQSGLEQTPGGPQYSRRATLASAPFGAVRPGQHQPPPYTNWQSGFQPPPDFLTSQRHASLLHHRRMQQPPHFGHGSSASISLPPGPRAPLPPRREIAEEDECPVCGREMPSKGPNNDEGPRIRHVEDCIKLYSSSASDTPGPSIPTATSNTDRHARASHALHPTISASAPSASSSASLPHAHSANRAPSASLTGPLAAIAAPQPQRGNRMIVYRATEKDCASADGSAQECVICMEDFETGDEMGRLDCFCKFHARCIRGWWESKAAGGQGGSCPTHQVTL